MRGGAGGGRGPPEDFGTALRWSRPRARERLQMRLSLRSPLRDDILLTIHNFACFLNSSVGRIHI